MDRTNTVDNSVPLTPLYSASMSSTTESLDFDRARFRNILRFRSRFAEDACEDCDEEPEDEDATETAGVLRRLEFPELERVDDRRACRRFRCGTTEPDRE